jgi:serine/threonine protein kinase
VIAKIAGGGMSADYLGRRVEAGDPGGGQVVALKIARHDVRMDERMLQMFLEEGKLIARLVHPSIVRTLEVGGDAEQDYIAMELMLGKTFGAIQDSVAARDVRLSPDIAAWTARVSRTRFTTRTSTPTSRGARSPSCIATSIRQTCSRRSRER